MQRASGAIQRLLSSESPYLPAILEVQLVFLAGLTWSTLNHGKRR